MNNANGTGMLLAAMGAVCLLMGCSDDDDVAQHDAGVDGQVLPDIGWIQDSTARDGESLPNGAIQVRVLDTGGQPLVDAFVVVNDVVLGTTDASGLFCAADLYSDADHKVHVKSLACSSNMRMVHVLPELTTSVDITCLPVNSTVLPEAAVGGTITGPNGFSVTLPPSSLTIDGDPVSGTVDVHYAILNRAADMAAAPGDMQAVGSGEEPITLESYGMVEVFFTKNGQPVAFDGEAELTFPMAPTSPAAHGDAVGLYYFNEETGLWEQQGMGTVDIQSHGYPVFRATVSHFSWWNVDVPLDNKSCFVGRLVDGNGDPVAQAYVGTIGVDYNSSTSTVTNSAGEYCLDVKQDALVQLKAWRNEEGVMWSADATGLQTGSSPAECGLGGCVDLGDFLLSESGLAPDCP